MECSFLVPALVSQFSEHNSLKMARLRRLLKFGQVALGITHSPAINFIVMLTKQRGRRRRFHFNFRKTVRHTRECQFTAPCSTSTKNCRAAICLSCRNLMSRADRAQRHGFFLTPPVDILFGELHRPFDHQRLKRIPIFRP